MSKADETIVGLDPTFDLKTFSLDNGAPPNITLQQRIYVPSKIEERAFPAWDFIIHIPRSNSLIFLQISISALRDHDRKSAGKYSIAESLTSPPGGGMLTCHLFIFTDPFRIRVICRSAYPSNHPN